MFHLSPNVNFDESVRHKKVHFQENSEMALLRWEMSEGTNKAKTI